MLDPEVIEYANRIIELLERQPGITILEILRNIEPEWHNKTKQIKEAMEYLRENKCIYDEYEHFWSPSRYYLMQ